MSLELGAAMSLRGWIMANPNEAKTKTQPAPNSQSSICDPI
jgi:hypothetical protein